MELIEFLKPMELAERESFAERCGTTYGHLRNVAYGSRPCSETLAINIDRESGGKVRCEKLCPGADWAYLRGSSARPPINKRKAG